MSVVEFSTNTRHEFFDTWLKEVCTKAGTFGDTYLVYEGFDPVSAYVYFPNAACTLVTLPDTHYDATPVHCVPHVDMCLTTFMEFASAGGSRTAFDVDDAPFGQYALEDVTLQSVVEHNNAIRRQVGSELVNECTINNHPDIEIRSMYSFVNLALGNPETLLSYIQYANTSRGYADFMSVNTNIVPAKYSMLEVRSEMKRCNEGLYDTYKKKMLSTMMLSALNNSRSKSEMEYKISGIAFELLADSVVSCMNTVWCFIDGLWQECSSDGYIWNFLTSNFIEYLMLNGAEAVALHIMSVNIRSRMMRDIKMRLQDDNFHTKLDSSRYAIRMNNGVYDTRHDTLSAPVPSDYVSVQTGVPYQIFDDNSHHVCRLMYILGTIFPDKDVLDYFMLSCSTFLEGYNSPKLFYIWWGTGNNAKTLVQTLVMKTFGDYCSTAPTSLVTGKRTESSNATPELCHVEKRLVVFLQEPNPEEKIKVGKMKEMTGNDSMYVRQLFKSGKTMVLKAKLVIVCNNIIEIPGMDAAIRRRISVIPFTSTFLDQSEYKYRAKKGILEQNSNIIDLSVEKELLSCTKAFMYVLSRRYREWVSRDRMLMETPAAIKSVTEDYVTRHNYHLKFIRHYLRSVVGSSFAAAEMYESFKEWFKKSYPGKRLVDFDVFTKEMSEEGYKDNGNGIILDVFMIYNGE